MAKYKVRDTETGQIIEVDESKLTDYGLSSADYKQQQPAPIQDTSKTEQPTDYITGRSLEEHMAAYQSAREADDTDAMKAIKEDYDREYTYQKDYINNNPELKKQNESKLVKEELATKAQAILDALDAGKSGKLKGKDYEAAKHFAASQFAASTGFKEGGKALTAPELTVLAGSMPNLIENKQGFIEKLLGKDLAQTGRVADSEEQLRRKALIAIALAQGKNIADPFTTEAPQQNTGFNVGGDIRNIFNGILGLPKATVDTTQKLASEGRATGTNIIADMLLNSGLNWAKNVNEDAGRPLEGGDVVGRIEQNFKDRPVSTILDVIPFLGPLGKASKTTKVPAPVSAIAEVPKTVGQTMRKDVRKIDVGPRLDGPAREAKINQTLDKLDITGSPEQQYGKLQSTMSKISDKIEVELNKNPQTVKLSEITDDFMTNLDDVIRSKNLTTKSAQREISSYLNDLYGKDLVDEIDTASLFKLKQKVNKDYKSVQKKLDNGTSLNDREKVIFAARQTLDDIIAKKHPEVKEATLMQSDLYDAVDSLHAGRTKKGGVNIFGKRIHTPDAVLSGKDYLGKILSGGGKNDYFKSLDDAEDVVSPLQKTTKKDIKYTSGNKPLEGAENVKTESSTLKRDMRKKATTKGAFTPVQKKNDK